MASSQLRLFLIVAVIAICLNGSTWAVVISLVPGRIQPGLTDKVTISCHPDSVSSIIVLLQLTKNGTVLATAVSGKPVQSGVLASNMKADGNIDKDPKNTSLAVTITKPEIENAGNYECKQTYLDSSFESKDEFARAQLIVTSVTETDIIKKKVKDLAEAAKRRDEELASLKNQVADLEKNGGNSTGTNTSVLPDTSAISDLENMVKKNNKTLEEQAMKLTDQEKSIAELKKLNEEQQNNTKALEKKVSDLANKTPSNTNSSSANPTVDLSAQDKKIADQEKLIKEQQNNTKDLEKKLDDLMKKLDGLKQNTTSDGKNPVPDDQANLIAEQGKRLSEQQNKTKELEDLISSLNAVAKEQNKTIEEQKQKLMNQEEAMMNQKNVTASLQALISDLQNQTSEQDKSLKDKAKTLQSQRETLTMHEGQIRDQQNKTMLLECKVSDLEQMAAEQNQTMQTQNAIMRALQRFTTDQGKQLAELQNKTMSQDGSASSVSAFSVGYRKEDTFTFGDTLKFGDVILNRGDHYNTTSGVYTAQWDGVYVFHLTALLYNNDESRIDLQLKMNDKTIIGSLFDQNMGDQSSVSTVVELKAGDTVKPVIGYGRNTLNPRDHYSLFAGYLLNRL